MRSSKLNLLDNARHLNLFLSKRASLIAAHNTSVEVQTIEEDIDPRRPQAPFWMIFAPRLGCRACKTTSENQA